MGQRKPASIRALEAQRARARARRRRLTDESLERAAEVRRVREGLAMTQAAFAAHLGATETSVWRWEHGYPVAAPWLKLIRAQATLRAEAAAPEPAAQAATQ